MSNDRPTFKVIFSCIAALPIFGPFLYLFVDMPRVGVPLALQQPPQPTRRMSAVMRYWLEREHLFLSGAGCIFLALALLAYWINDWNPGEIHQGIFGAYTDVDVTFYSLLILAVLSFGSAFRPNARVQREWDTERMRRDRHDREITRAQRDRQERLPFMNRWQRRHVARGVEKALSNSSSSRREEA